MAGQTNSTKGPGPSGGRVFFDAILRPNRSLSPFGFRLLIAVFGTALFAVGSTFWMIGAWPVMGFCGLELVLLYGAFRLNFRSGGAYERLRLSDDGLEISRMRPNGAVARVWRLQPAWLRIDIDNPPEHDSQLTLSSHGRRMVVGSFLTPDERLEVAEALREALVRWRTAPHPSAAS
jgi:uncharacterized membrane protein